VFNSPMLHVLRVEMVFNSPYYLYEELASPKANGSWDNWNAVKARTKVGLGFTNYIIENELGWDDYAFSVFTIKSEDVEDHIDLDESQMSYGTKSSTSSDSKSVSNDFVSYDDSDKSLEVNKNDFVSSDSSVKSSKPKPKDSTSCASTFSVSTSMNEAEIESNVGTPIQEPIIIQDLPSFSSNSFDKNEHTSRTSCNKNGYFNKKAGHFRKNASSVSKLCFVSGSGSGTHLIKDYDLTSKLNIPPARPQRVPTGKPKVFVPVPTGRPNRPFSVPTDRGYSPSVSFGNKDLSRVGSNKNNTVTSMNFPTATMIVAPARVTAIPSRRRKGVVIRDPESESATSSIISAETKSIDKGIGIMVEEPKPLKKKQQIELDEEYARKLHEELNKDIDWDETIDHVKLKAKELDYIKIMSYDDIRLIFEAEFNSNMDFLLKTKEQMKEEESRALQTINKTLAEKETKKRRLNEEVEDLKRHLEICLMRMMLYILKLLHFGEEVPTLKVYSKPNAEYCKTSGRGGK
nr:hypothetical protein [Tanacetum cinerariifolium]